MTPRRLLTVPVLFLATLLAGAAPAAGAPERLCKPYSGEPAATGSRAGMVRVPGGTFVMGDDDEHAEERYEHPVEVSGFWIDRHEVTNAQFAWFVAATGYLTIAEQAPPPAFQPNVPPELLQPGSIVFAPPADSRLLEDVSQWWEYRAGASWRAPEGPGSTVVGRENHPVVHIAQADAAAYARWLGRDLQTEAQWELAARGGLEGATYAWGEDYYDPAEGWRANSWQGPFPALDEAEDGFHGLAPVGCFAPNGHGLFDMTGNAWEYARDWYVPGHPATPEENPTGPGMALAARLAGPDGPATVIKGGSWLCAPSFCARYRPGARQPHEPDLGTSHVGFRTVLRGEAP